MVYYYTIIIKQIQDYQVVEGMLKFWSVFLKLWWVLKLKTVMHIQMDVIIRIP